MTRGRAPGLSGEDGGEGTLGVGSENEGSFGSFPEVMDLSDSWEIDSEDEGDFPFLVELLVGLPDSGEIGFEDNSDLRSLPELADSSESQSFSFKSHFGDDPNDNLEKLQLWLVDLIAWSQTLRQSSERNTIAIHFLETSLL